MTLGPIFGVPAGPRLVFRLVPEPDTDILRPYMVGLVVRYPDSAIQAAKSCCLFRDVKPVLFIENVHFSYFEVLLLVQGCKILFLKNIHFHDFEVQKQ